MPTPTEYPHLPLIAMGLLPAPQKVEGGDGAVWTQPDSSEKSVNLGGISGLETSRRLSSKHPNIPVIFITASDAPEVRKQASELGCAAFLLKPLRPGVLIAAVRQAIGGCVSEPLISGM